MISYRQADILERFKKSPLHEVVATLYVDQQIFTNSGRCITSYIVDVETTDVSKRAAIIRFVDDVFESLPSFVRNHYQQHPSGFASHRKSDLTLTVVSESAPGEDLIPSPVSITSAIESAYARRGIVNEQRGDAQIAVGPTSNIFVDGIYKIRWADVPESFTK